ncbi:class I SAM-dependent methyltransferase [Candidatus Woesebacteria bacterium]|nr:class I SAM-dependent methyltransferase [Candidatus Woesebacteria bacterium]
MTKYNDLAYQYRGAILPTFVPHVETFAKRTLARFRNEVPHVLEVGAGTGSLLKKVDELGNFVFTAVDASPFSLTELTPAKSNMNLVRKSIFDAEIKTPVHAIISKDYLIAISSLEAFLEHISPSLVHGALFMLTVFADEPGTRHAFSGKYGRKWDLVNSQSWTPAPREVDNDWYSSIVATRRIFTCQYSGS